MSLSQADKRRLWSPRCQRKHRAHLFDAYAALDLVFKTHGYAPRAGETWGANCRNVTGGNQPSIHSFFDDEKFVSWNGVELEIAVARDTNSKTNPYSSRLITDRPRAMVENVIAIRTTNGQTVWDWGGYFSGNKDAMHDEIGCSPASLATGIDWSTVYGHPSCPRTPKTSPTPVTPPTTEEDDMPLRVVQCREHPTAGEFLTDCLSELRTLSIAQLVHGRNLGFYSKETVQVPHEWIVAVDASQDGHNNPDNL